jgi:lipoprotein-anchoring transpeptidase ErfK/SrfK
MRANAPMEKALVAYFVSMNITLRTTLRNLPAWLLVLPAVLPALALAALPAHSAKAPRPAAQQLTPDIVNNAGLTPVVDDKARAGAAVLRIQVLLDRARFSPGEIDAAFGSNVKRAIAAYQRSNDLSVTGSVDAATWAALNRDSAPVLATYRITDADAAGPFVPIPADMLEKSKLPALGFSSLAEALGEKFHASPKLLQQLNPGKDFSRAGTEIVVPNVEQPSPLPKGAKVIVDQSDASVVLVNEAGKVLARFPATMGSSQDPLPVGNWKIQGVGRNPVFHYNPKLFWDAKPGDEKAKLQPGPNNPVGVAWIDLSKEHYGIHGTPEPSTIGKTQSHGCIRLTNWDVAALAQAVAPGMLAILQE